MENFLHSFSSVERKTIVEVDSRCEESDQNVEHQIVENPGSWNPPTLNSKDMYKFPSLFRISKKTVLKEVEVKIKIQGPFFQIVGLNIFSVDEIKNFRSYAEEKKFSYLHFGGIQIGLAPLFKQWFGDSVRIVSVHSSLKL